MTPPWLQTTQISASGTWVVDGAADLPDALDDELHAGHAGLRQQAAAGVDRQLAAELDARRPRTNGPPSPLGAEAVVLERHQRRDREAVVELGDVDVGGRRCRPSRTPSCAETAAAVVGQARAQRRPPRRSGPGRSRGSAPGPGRRAARARSALITTTAAPPSEIRQQSSRRSGSTTSGDSWCSLERQRLAQVRVRVGGAVLAAGDRRSRRAARSSCRTPPCGAGRSSRSRPACRTSRRRRRRPSRARTPGASRCAGCRRVVTSATSHCPASIAIAA